MKSVWSGALVGAAGLAMAAGASAQVNGDISGDGYGPAVALQTVETGFGDNFSELNGMYTRFAGGRLYVGLTGNVEANFNKLEIFLDSNTMGNGTQAYSGIPGNDSTNRMGPAGGGALIFDNGFAPDVHLIFRRGFRTDLDMAVLNTGLVSSFFDVFGGGANQGSGVTLAGPANAFPLELGYLNNNVAGILGGVGPANQAAAALVTTGVEFSIDLRDLNLPDEVCLLAFQNGDGHHYASNQFLPGVPAPQGNFGGDMFGGFTGVLSLDLRLVGGDQFVCVRIPAPGAAALLGLGGLIAARRRRS